MDVMQVFVDRLTDRVQKINVPVSVRERRADSLLVSVGKELYFAELVGFDMRKNAYIIHLQKKEQEEKYHGCS